MNKFFNNFSKYLLIISLGFASTQATDGDKETKEKKETKKLDRIISKQKIIMVGEAFIAIFQVCSLCFILAICNRRHIWPFSLDSYFLGNELELSPPDSLRSDDISSSNQGSNNSLYNEKYTNDCTPPKLRYYENNESQ